MSHLPHLQHCSSRLFFCGILQTLKIMLSWGLSKPSFLPSAVPLLCPLSCVSCPGRVVENKPSKAEENLGSSHSFPGKEEQPWVHFSKPTLCSSPHKQIKYCQRWRWQQLLGAVLRQSESPQEPPWGKCQTSFASHEVRYKGDYQLTHLCKHTARSSLESWQVPHWLREASDNPGIFPVSVSSLRRFDILRLFSSQLAELAALP